MSCSTLELNSVGSLQAHALAPARVNHAGRGSLKTRDEEHPHPGRGGSLAKKCCMLREGCMCKAGMRPGLTTQLMLSGRSG